jgi:N-acylneuraminate cytidylyltransferase
MFVCCVIPARGGSKSILRKNVSLLNGEPLIKYSIDYSLRSNLVNATIVSTDCTEIAEISQKLGALVPFIRPSEYATDECPDFPVMHHALVELELYFKQTIDLMVLLRPTSPLRPNGLIEKGIEIITKNPDSTSVRTVAKSQEHPYRQWIEDGNFITGFCEDANESYNIPRQKLPTVYFQTGDLELIKRKTLEDGSVSGDRVMPLFVDSDLVVDIDEPKDLDLAKERIEIN